MVLFMCVSPCFALVSLSVHLLSVLCAALALPLSCLLPSQGLRVRLGGLKSNVGLASALANEKSRSKPESMAVESLQQCVG